MKRAAIIIAGALIVIAALIALRRSLHREPLGVLAKTADGAREGSWQFPRGGPYILAYEAPGPARLLIDGRPVVSGAGERIERVIYAPGIHAVRFEGSDATRLLWHPPGRRGALEYVPASSLSPDPPERARFTSGAGAHHTDAAIASGIVLTLLLAGALLIGIPRPDPTWALPAAIFAIALIVRLAGLGGAGQTWDEDEYWCAGRNYLQNILSLDFSPHAWRWNYEHPPVTKYLAGLGALWADGYGPARGLFAAAGALGATFVALIGRRLGGVRVAILAGLGAALLPRLIAHDQIVGHETPSFLWWSLGVWLALRVGEADSLAATARRLLGVGVVLGVAVATRFSNLLLGPVLGVAVLAGAPAGRHLRATLVGLVATPVAALLTFVALWPRMWSAPKAHLDAAWAVLRRQHLPEHYLGHIVQQPPWHYFPVYLIVTTPVVVITSALLLGGWRGVARREPRLLLLLVWLLLPLGVIWSPVRQDGVRYVIPALGALCLLAALGLDHLASSPALARFRAAPLVVAVLYAAYLGVTWARIRPYGLDYFGEHVGGPSLVARKEWFEIGWWGEGIAEAVTRLNREAAPGATVSRIVQPVHVNWLREDLWTDPGPARAQWILVNDQGLMANGQPRGWAPAGASLAYEVTAQGASLVRVYRR